MWCEKKDKNEFWKCAMQFANVSLENINRVVGRSNNDKIYFERHPRLHFDMYLEILSTQNKLKTFLSAMAQYL